MPPPWTGHYIRRNEVSRIPRRHVIMDTEGLIRPANGGEVQTWRCGVVSFAELRKDGTWQTATREYMLPGLMWSQINAFTYSGGRTVIWAHNLAYDLRTARALPALHGLGWDLDDIRLARQGTWARWKHHKATLTAVDSFAVWPVSLETVGAALGMDKPPLPAGDDMAAWLHRCRADVDILTTAVLNYLDWLRAADMGTWQMTGAGQSYAAFRHKFLSHDILVADDMRAREAERRAMWTGRAEAWRYGENEREYVYDWDWQNSYARIARDCELPVRQTSISRGLALSYLLKLAKRQAILAEVEVSTDVPVVPCERDGYIVWPVGQFSSVLWDPELALLASAGARVKTGRIWLYRKQPVLTEWAKWILGELARPDEDVPPWRKLVLKHWSRALIGRFAMQYTTWDPYATSEQDDIRLMSGHDVDTDEPFELMQVGTDVSVRSGTTEGRDSVPAITGYVMAEQRRRLWEVVQLVGEEHVYYMDTDSLLLTTQGNRNMQLLAGDPRVEGLRLKRRYKGWQIAGPRKLVLGGVPRIAGVPKRAVQTGPWRFEGEVWRGLAESIRVGELDAVRVTSRTFRVMQTDCRRVRRPDGRTMPVELEGES